MGHAARADPPVIPGVDNGWSLAIQPGQTVPFSRAELAAAGVPRRIAARYLMVARMLLTRRLAIIEAVN